MLTDAEPLLTYVRLRREAQQRREAGESPPWSPDPVIASRHFCCVIRDDDRTSREVRAIIQGLPPFQQLPAALTFRLYNRPSTLCLLLEAGAYTDATLPQVEAALREIKPVFNTVAYRVTLPGGLWNLPSLARAILRARRMGVRQWRPRERAELAVQQLQGELTVGPFLAYQVMQDLRWLGHKFEDEDEYCMAGGGSLMGAARLTGNYSSPKKDKKNRTDHNVTRPLTPTERALWATWLSTLKATEPRANMFELEHNLCELNKWLGISSGENAGRAWRPRP